MTIPTLVIQVAFTDDPLTEDGTATWVDIGAYFRPPLSIQRGRNHERDTVQAGTALLSLLNTDRRFDPDKRGEAYPYDPYAIDPGFDPMTDPDPHTFILPMRKIRIGASYDMASYLNPEWIFVGYVESWKMRYEGGTIAYADLTCVDAFKYFSLARVVSSGFASDLTDVTVTAILDALDWPAGDRVIATGDITLPEMEVDDTALSQLQKVVKAEDGLFFISRSGDATFQNQDYRDGLSSVATFSNDPVGADLPYAKGGLTLRYDDTNIWNQIYVTRVEGDIEQHAFDATSRDTFLTRSLRLPSELLVDDTAALARAERLLARYKDALVRPEKFVIDPAVRDSWGDVLTRDLSDIVTIERTYLQDGDTMTIDAHIEASGIVIPSLNKWRVTWQLSPVVTLSPGAGTLATLSIWRAPTLLNSWVNSGPSSLDAGYWKDKDGWVHLRGTIKGGASNTTAWVLPTGYWPRGHMRIPIVAEGFSTAWLFITDNGLVRPQVSGGWSAGDYVDLSGISFRVI